MARFSIPLSPPLSESLDKRVPLEASKWNLLEIPIHNPLQKVEVGLAGRFESLWFNKTLLILSGNVNKNYFLRLIVLMSNFILSIHA
jgi:hypothetical protein